jgi:hypothetical protein
MDFPVDGSETDQEAVYFITIAELPKTCRGTRYADQCSFIQVRTSDVGYRSLAFENESFTHTIDLGKPQTFTEFNITIRYRLNTSETLVLESDYSAIFRISD